MAAEVSPKRRPGWPGGLRFRALIQHSLAYRQNGHPIYVVPADSVR